MDDLDMYYEYIAEKNTREKVWKKCPSCGDDYDSAAYSFDEGACHSCACAIEEMREDGRGRRARAYAKARGRRSRG